MPAAPKYYILGLSKNALAAFELYKDLINARNSFNIWGKCFWLSRMAEIQLDYSPCNTIWTSTLLGGPCHIKLGKIWQRVVVTRKLSQVHAQREMVSLNVIWWATWYITHHYVWNYIQFLTESFQIKSGKHKQNYRKYWDLGQTALNAALSYAICKMQSINVTIK